MRKIENRSLNIATFFLFSFIMLARVSGVPARNTTNLETAQEPQSTPQPTPQPHQPEPEPEPGADDDPTRAVFFSIREEYRNLTGGAWNNRLIFRKDAVVLKGTKAAGRTGFILRTDIPITTTHLGSETHTGLGDIYGQALYIPYLTRKFAFVTGTGLVMPTATHRTLGLGKWQVAPLAVPVWFLPKKKGYFQVKIQDFISVAGVGDRPDVHQLFINPLINYLPAKRWLVQAEAESRTNFKNGGRTDFRVGFGAGRVITRRFFLGIKVELPLGATRPGDWTLKVTNIFYR